MDPDDRITLDPAVRSGKPVVRGTRITVADVLEYLAGGMTPAEIVADFPDLTADDIRAVLRFAAERERRIFSAAACSSGVPSAFSQASMSVLSPG